MSTRAQLLSEIAAQFPDNTTGAITPAKLRQVTEDIANSCAVPAAGTGTITASSITDASASGRTVLIGTPAQAREAIGFDGTVAAAVAGINLPVRSAMTGDVVLTAASAQNQWLAPDADHAVTLQAEVAGVPWVSTVHHAGAASTISVKRASAVVVASLIPGSTITVVWDGTAISIL